MLKKLEKTKLRVILGCAIIGVVSLFLELFIRENYFDNFHIVLITSFISGIYCWKVIERYLDIPSVPE